MSETGEPTVTITTVYTKDGWTTTATLPDGEVIVREMRRAGPGRFVGGPESEEEEDEDLPEEVYEMISSLGHMDVCQWLNIDE